MGRTPYRPRWGSEYPGTNVTDDPASDGPGLAPQVIAPPALVVGGQTWLNGDRYLVCNATTGVVGWNRQWTLGNPNRKRAQFFPNRLSADFRAVGFEGAVPTPTATGTGGATVADLGAPGPFISLNVGDADGDWAGFRTSLFELYKWVWNVTVAVEFRTAPVLDDQRIWVACTKEPLNGVSAPTGTAPAGGAVSRTVALRYDSDISPNFYAVSWDGSSVEAVDTGIAVLADKAYRFKVESEGPTNGVRWYLENWADGIDHGLIRSDTWASMPANQVFGLDVVIEALDALVEPILLLGTMTVEHR